MKTLQNIFFRIFIINLFLIFVVYCHSNGLEHHYKTEIEKLFKREISSDVFTSLESFEDGEELLQESSLVPIKRSICNIHSAKTCDDTKIETDKKENKKTGDSSDKKEDKKSGDLSDKEVDETSEDSLDIKLPGSVSLVDDKKGPDTGNLCSTDPMKVPNSLQELFKNIENFFININTNFMNLTRAILNSFNKFKLNNNALNTKTVETFSNLFNLLKKSNNTSIPSGPSTDVSSLLASLEVEPASVMSSLALRASTDDENVKISTCLENIQTNITAFSELIKKRIGNSENFLNKFLTGSITALNPLSKFNLKIFDNLLKKRDESPGSSFQKPAMEELIKQNNALQVLQNFLVQLRKEINDFWSTIARKWSREEQKVRNRGIFGSIRANFGWPFFHSTTHTTPAPNLFQKIFNWPSRDAKNRNDAAFLLKKIFKLPGHDQLNHHNIPISIIKHILNSLYSIFNLNSRCECPNETTQRINSPVRNFFNWMDSSSTSRPTAASTSNSHYCNGRNIPSACSCS